MRRPVYCVALIVGLTYAGPSRAADDDKPLGSDGCNHTFERAGYPDQVSKLAQLGRTPSYCGYNIGGGCTFRGGAPGPLQGTWGYDYCCGPCNLRHKVMLGWCFACRPKGYTGAYKTDGPPVTNVFGYKLPEAEKAGESCAECGKH